MDELAIVSDGSAFVLRNRSDRFPVVYVLLELNSAAVIDLAPCELWTTFIPVRGQVRVDYDDVWGYSEDAEMAVVYWCFLDGSDVVSSGSRQVPFT